METTPQGHDDREPAYIILGATGGIGSALSHRLAQSGSRLVLAARNPTNLHTLVQETGGHAHVLDAIDTGAVQTCVEQTVERFGRLDGIANCIGSLLLKPAHLTSDDEWNEIIATNLGSAFATVKSGARAMRKDGGSIVLVASVAARFGLPNHEAIAAAKAGVIGLVMSAAASYAPRGIRVNGVAPGMVRTPLTARLTASESALNASIAMHALGRIGEPSDVASAIAWLLDPEQSWVTGQVLSVDGGMSTVRPQVRA